MSKKAGPRMSKLKKSIFISVVIVLVLLVASAAFLTLNNHVDQSNYKEAMVEARTEIWHDINLGKASSATIAIMDNGQIVYSEGFAMADRENSVPVNTQTMFNIGSISKTFCAVAVLQLVDEGKVNLDDPVINYLPEFHMADARYTNITVRMLLDHTSGLPGTVWANNVGYAYNPTFYQDTIDSLSLAYLKAAPGEFAPYTNDGFTLAEMLVAKVSGQNYTDYLSQKIFKPLALDHTSVSIGDQPDKNIAEYYRLDNGKSVPPEVLSVIGAGGLSSTAEDLVRFADSLSNGGKQILSQSSIGEMTKAQPSTFVLRAEQEAGINPEFSFGLGLDVVALPYYHEKGLSVIGKGGDTEDYHSMLLSAPDQRLSVAVIESGHGSSAVKIAFDVLNTVLQQKGLMQKDPTPEVTPTVPQTIPAKYTAFEGYYAPCYKISFDFQANACMLTVLSNDGTTPSIPLAYRDGYFYTAEGGKFSFVSVDGHNYLVASIFNDMAHMVFAEQLQPLNNPQSLSINVNGAEWLRRNVEPFEALSLAPPHIVVSTTLDDLLGYVVFSGIKEVKSPDYAAMPSSTVRDQTELNLIQKDKQVWAQVYDSIYCPASLATPLNKGTSTVTIGDSGYNEWFKVSFDAVLSFQVPAKDRVIVFSPDGSPLYDSALYKGDVFVPQGSFVELAGMPGDVINVTAK